jgi:hypothetical protein
MGQRVDVQPAHHHDDHHDHHDHPAGELVAGTFCE